MTRGQVMANEKFGFICVDETLIQLPFILHDFFQLIKLLIKQYLEVKLGNRGVGVISVNL